MLKLVRKGKKSGGLTLEMLKSGNKEAIGKHLDTAIKGTLNPEEAGTLLNEQIRKLPFRLNGIKPTEKRMSRDSVLAEKQGSSVTVTRTRLIHSYLEGLAEKDARLFRSFSLNLFGSIYHSREKETAFKTLVNIFKTKSREDPASKIAESAASAIIEHILQRDETKLMKMESLEEMFYHSVSLADHYQKKKEPEKAEKAKKWALRFYGETGDWKSNYREEEIDDELGNVLAKMHRKLREKGWA